MSDHDFNTPPELLDIIRQLDPHGIGLDPCSNAYSMVDARVAYTLDTNGLIQSWRGHGLVFVNPPHSMSPNNIEPWMEKAYGQFIEVPHDPEYHGERDSLVCLVPAKTDTAWFHDYTTAFRCRCFLRGRPRFWHKGRQTPGPGKFASMVLYHGPNTGLFMHLFCPLGFVV